MSDNSKRGFNPTKGLSFIDWEELNEEQYVQINQIINVPHGTKSQFPFPQDTHYSAGPTKALQECDVANTPVFEPSVMPPSVMGYHPVPAVPMWTTGSDPGGHHYQMSVPAGYVFPNGCESSVAFVPTYSNGHPPVYAYAGHPMQAHHFHENMMPPMMPIHGVPQPHLAPHGEVPHHPIPVTITQAGMPIAPPPPAQVVYISSPPPPVEEPHIEEPTDLTVVVAKSSSPPRETPTTMSNDVISADTKQAPETSPPRPPAVTGPGLVASTSTSASFEFAGPVVYSPPDDAKSVSLTEQNNNELSLEEKTSSNDIKLDVVIDIGGMSVSATNAAFSPTAESTGNVVATSSEVSQDVVVVSNNISSNHQASPPPAPVVTESPQQQQEVETPTSPAVSPSSLPSPAAPQQPTVKSWSSLFAGKASENKKPGIPVHPTNNAPEVRGAASSDADFPAIGGSQVDATSAYREWKPQKPVRVPLEKVTTVAVHSDPLACRLQDQISDLQIVHTPVVIQPRGLKNGHNTCFLNAPLQVLMGCAPFVHMFRSFKHLPARTGSQSSTPVLDSLIQFVNSFQNGQRMRNPAVARNKKGNLSMDLSIGQSFIPEPLLSVAQNVLGLNIGVQHDAEEFLSQILSICNEEMEKIIKMDNSNGSDEEKVVANGASRDDEHLNQDFDDEEDEDDAWQQVGPKKHHVETNVNDCGQTPLSNIFAGLSRTCLTKETGKTSDTLDSFFTVKLDIQADSVHSVKDALLRLNTVETVHDPDGRKVHGQRRMFFDVLPDVLIMHLKLFEYSNGNGQKIQKKIGFDVDLQVPKEIISRVGKTKYASPKSRNYKLFGVVNHHGRKMNDGHYTSDVFLPVVSGWLRFDDSDIALIQEADVCHYSDTSMPYLLFYRRMEALMAA